MSNKAIQMTDGNNNVMPISAEAGGNALGKYVKFADGLLIQWGESNVPYSSAPVSLPTDFADTDYTVACQYYGSATTGQQTYNVRAFQTNKFSAYASTGNVCMRWVAIGRWR